MINCITCKGRKWVEESEYVSPSGTSFEGKGQMDCPDCNGTGDDLVRLQIIFDDEAQKAMDIIDGMVERYKSLSQKLSEITNSFQEN